MTGDDGGLGRKKLREIPLALLLLAPSLLIFCVFVFYPMGRTIWLGFYREDPFGGRVYAGFTSTPTSSARRSSATASG